MGLDQYGKSYMMRFDAEDLVSHVPAHYERPFASGSNIVPKVFPWWPDVLWSEIGYWRKNWPLHEWFRELYEARGGAEDFNCVDLVLTSADLDRLEADFAGDKDGVPLFVTRARDELGRGNVVCYSAWY